MARVIQPPAPSPTKGKSLKTKPDLEEVGSTLSL